MLLLDGVRKGFGGAAVIDGVSLRVERGETVGIVGPAASGKSVLLKLLCTLLRPDAGRVCVGGEEVSGLDEDRLMAVRARFGMLFQNNALFDFLDIADNVAFPLVRKGGVPAEEIARRAGERLRAVGLLGSEAKFPGELSGGMRKRAAIARALIAEPEVVLYDEPTAGLDPVTTSKIYDLLRAERDRTGATVVVVSSDVEALCAFVPRLLLVHAGRLRYDGPAEGARDAPDPLVRQFVRGELSGPL